MSVSKRLRFEVFKRDKFTCQYCGAKAPDVVLHADHVEPKSKGGEDTALNLVTACAACNMGKGAKRLSDDSTLSKQRAQLADLQERQEQIAMMMEWQRSLVDMDAQEVEEVVSFWCDTLGKFSLSESARVDIRKLLSRFGLQDVTGAMRIAIERYVVLDDNGEPTIESAGSAFSKLGGICRLQVAERDSPYLKDVFYIRAILKNRLSYVDPHRSKAWLEEAFRLGGDAETLRGFAVRARNWTQWRNQMDDYLNSLAGEGEVERG